MARIHAFEIHELPGCPDLLRRICTDYLRTIGEVFRAFEPVEPLLAAAIEKSEERTLVDLCSGGSGPAVTLAEQAKTRWGTAPTVVLSDLFPNRRAFAWAAERATVPVKAELEPIDARAVPARLRGARSLFDAFHHFRPADAREILADAARSKSPILVVEATERSAPAIIGMLLFVPLFVLLLTPLVRPFSWGRLLFTYVVPLAVPLIVFDGIISCLRSYSLPELRELTQGLETDGYRFHVGTKKSKGQKLTYLLGCEGELPSYAAAS